MSRDPTNNSVLQFRKKRLHNWPTQSASADMLAEALLLPTPLEPDAGDPLPRGKKLYGQAAIRWLFDPPLSRHFSRPIRLYFYLQIKSRRGARVVRLTNEVAAALGLDRRDKTRALRELERDGLITVERSGKRLPVVTVRRLASTDFE